MAHHEFQITVRVTVDPRHHPTDHQREGLREALATTMSGKMLMAPTVTWEDHHHAGIVLRGVNTDAHAAGESARMLVERNAAQQNIYVASADVVDIVRCDDWPRSHPPVSDHM